MVINSPSRRSHLGRTGFTRTAPQWGPNTRPGFMPGPPRRFAQPYRPTRLAAPPNFTPRFAPRFLGPLGLLGGLALWYWWRQYDGPIPRRSVAGTLPGYRYTDPTLPFNAPPYNGNPLVHSSGGYPPRSFVYPGPAAGSFWRWYGREGGPNPFNPVQFLWWFTGFLYPGNRFIGFGPSPGPMVWPGVNPGVSGWPGFYPPPVHQPGPYRNPGTNSSPGTNPGLSPPPPGISGRGNSLIRVRNNRPPPGTRDLKVRNKLVQAFFLGIEALSEGWEILDIALDVAGVDRTKDAADQLMDLFLTSDADFDYLEFWREVQLNTLEDRLWGKFHRAYKNALTDLGVTVTSKAPEGWLSGLANWQPPMAFLS